MKFKQVIKYQLKEYLEMAKSPWFWLFYIVGMYLGFKLGIFK